MRTPDPRMVAVVRDAARPLPAVGDDAEFDELLAAIGDARFVLLGEASHGTHEFYTARAPDAEQNAALVKNAERYYRTMFLGDVSSWNLRDSHMVETLWALQRHLARERRPARIVVWAHNSHLGDASATEMGRQRGEHNVGQLVRERCGAEAFLVGFSTHTGSVTAASDWDRPAQRKRVLPSRHDSVEGVMHATGLERFLLRLRDDPAAAQALRHPLLERAIGVIYRPDTERQSHYFFVELPRQFDALLHFDTTSAVVPLESNVEWHAEDHEEVPETFPAGL